MTPSGDIDLWTLTNRTVLFFQAYGGGIPLKHRLPLPRVWLVIACSYVFGGALVRVQLIVGRESEFYYAGKKYYTCSDR